MRIRSIGSVTEIGLGSALFKSYIFDEMHSLDTFKPSLFMILRVARKPTNSTVTTYSGGFYSSQNGKCPKFVHPRGLKSLGRGQFGESRPLSNFQRISILDRGI